MRARRAHRGRRNLPAIALFIGKWRFQRHEIGVILPIIGSGARLSADSQNHIPNPLVVPARHNKRVPGTECGFELMTKKKRHSETEIAAKLQQADTLATQGKTQREIAKALGISVMTFHRWRKSHPQRSAPPSPSYPLPAGGRQNRAAALETENARLRKLVADLLLEKMRLEEELQYKSRPLKRNG